jgi:hypothetical protein
MVPVFLAPDGSLVLATGCWQSVMRPVLVTEQVPPALPAVNGLTLVPVLEPLMAALGLADGVALGVALALGDALALALGVGLA